MALRPVRPEPVATLPRTAADVLSRHVVFEIESIDRLYLNVYVPKLQRVEQVVGFLTRHLGFEIASTALVAKRTEAFVAGIKRYAADHGVPLIDFVKGQRKDDVMHEHLASCDGSEQVRREQLVRSAPVPQRSAPAVRPGGR